MSDLLLSQLERDGIATIPDFVPPQLLEELRNDLNDAYTECQNAQNANNLEAKQDKSVGSLKGVAHHVLSQGKSFLKLLELRPAISLIEKYLNSQLTVYNFGAFINEGKEVLYKHGMSIHRDTRTPDFGKQIVVVMVTLDEFTSNNGATYLLPRSHQQLERPSDELFYANAKRAITGAGSLVIFDARIWHAAGQNIDGSKRRALTLAFTRPCFKPQFDYCRALGEANVALMSANIKQLVGYNSRTPASLEQWYQPLDYWYYQKGQDAPIV